MKKIISVILTISMLLSFAGICSVAFAADGLAVAVASDLHYDPEGIRNAEAENQDPDTEPDIDNAFIKQDEAFSHVSVSGQLYLESEAILNEFIRQIKENSGINAVILTGDLTDAGTAEASNKMAEKLAELETSTGKSVFVVPGNHDVLSLTKQEFSEIYYAFGYGPETVKDPGSLSYAVDLDDTYRLIVIDTVEEAQSGFGFSEERFNWVKEQCQRAKDEKKHIIAAMHHNMLQHFAYDFVREGAIIDSSYGLAELFAEYDVKYTFSGHTHANDIMQYTGENGNVIYEATTGALNAYPVSYRVVNFSESAVDFKIKSINNVDTSGFAALGISEKAISYASSDFKGYSQYCYRLGIKELFSDALCTATLKNYLGVDYESEQRISLIVDKVGDKLEDIVVMPLYNKDKKESVSIELDNQPQYSIEQIANSYGNVIPASDYKDLIDVMVLLYETHVAGAEGLSIGSNEFLIVVNGLAAALNYCLFSISEEEYGALIQFLAKKLEPTVLGKIPVSIYAYMASGKQQFERNIAFIMYLISPFIKNSVSDTVPSDRDVTLTAYNPYPADPTTEPNDPEPSDPGTNQDNSFKAKLAAFFDKISEFFKMIFRVLSFQEIFK